MHAVALSIANSFKKYRSVEPKRVSEWSFFRSTKRFAENKNNI
jgi:hypothetical protein